MRASPDRARDRGRGGVGVWHLGTEDQTTWAGPLVAPGIAWSPAWLMRRAT